MFRSSIEIFQAIIEFVLVSDFLSTGSGSGCPWILAAAHEIYRCISLIPGAEYISSCRCPFRSMNSIAEKSRLSTVTFFLNSSLPKIR